MRTLAARRSSGVTILELLVACAIFVAILCLVLSLTSSTAGLTGLAERRMEADGEMRGALDRIFADFTAAVVREDLPPLFKKSAGNDEVYFHARADGYSGDRGISLIGYRIRDMGLERGVQGTGWSTNKMAFSQNLGSSAIVSGTGSPYDSVGERVLRLETEYVRRDGSVVAGPPPTNWQEISAVVVSLASVDEKSWQKARGTLAEMAALFPDAEDGSRVMESWAGLLSDTNFMRGDEVFPAPVRNGLRVRQRVLSVRR